MKKLLSVILALVMVFALTVPAFAAQSVVIEDDIYPWYDDEPHDYLYKIDADSVIKNYQTEVVINSYGWVDTYEVSGPATIYIENDVVNGGGIGFICVKTDDINKIINGTWNGGGIHLNQNSSGSGYYAELDNGVYFFSGMVGKYPAKANLIVIVKEKEPVYTLRSFSDVPASRWSNKAIMEMVDMGLFNGTSEPDKNGTARFTPAGTMTRAQFITVVTRMLYAEELANAKEGAYWYSKYYNVAVEKGLITDQEFSLDGMTKQISRQEMALIAVRTAEARGEDTKVTVDDKAIADYATVGRQYKASVKKAYAMGLITGVDDAGTFAPKNTLTREQGAMVAYRLIKESERVIPSGVKKGEEPEAGSDLPDGAMIIYEGQKTSRPAKEGDLFVKEDGTEVVLKIGPHGILGEGQNVAPDKRLTGKTGRWNGSTFNFYVDYDGYWTDSTGKSLNNNSYRVNLTTGEGHWLSEWKVLEKAYPEPEKDGTYNGQISTDPFKMYRWYDIFESWMLNTHA